MADIEPDADLGPRASSRASSLGDRYDRQRNSFTPVRLIFATMVLYSHSWPLSVDGEDQVKRLTGGVTSFGNIAVLGFFVISGFLVTQSVLQARGRWWPLSYLANRALRILPALAASAAIVAFAIGPAVSRLPAEQYFAITGRRNPWSYVFDTMTFDAFGLHDRIRDVFATTPFGAAINGSLWSLRFEVAMYLLLLGLAVVAGRRLDRLAPAAATVFGLLFLGRHLAGQAILPVGGWVFANDALLLQTGTYFFVGATLYTARNRIAATWRLAGVLAGIGLLVGLAVGVSIGLVVVLPYIAVMAALSSRGAAYTARFGDYSYGTYLYAFPVEQVIALRFSPISPPAMTLIALPITLAIAVASWHIVERPALDLKRRWQRPARAGTGPATAPS